MNVMYLGRRKAVKLKLRIFCTQRLQQVLVPLDIKIGMKTALHKDARSAERERLVYPLTDLVYRMDICVRLSRPAIKRAERADYVADIRVVDVPVDDVRDNI